MKNYAFIFILTIVSFSLTGCFTAKQNITTLTTPPLQIDATNLNINSLVAVASEGDGYFEGLPHPRSGLIALNKVVSILEKHGFKCLSIRTYLEQEEALETAESKNVDHLFYLTLEHWEERATEWSGKPDKINVIVNLYDVENKCLIGAHVINASSKWATFGGDHPEDLIEVPFNEILTIELNK